MRRAVPVVWAVVLPVLMLWQALAAGFVLTYDMVWVPDLALRPDFLGLGSALPRAVPSDAVVAVLDEVVPGMLLQKVVLLGALVGGGLGAVRLAPSTSRVAQLAAVSVFQWNPFVVERLVLGHWPVLLGYAALPWLVVVSRTARVERRFPPALFLLLPLASLSASAGLVAALVTLVFGIGARTRTNLALVGAVVAANAPWLVAGALHAGAATTDAAGASAFALHDTGWLPAPIAALGLGGIWNSEVVPASRTGFLGVVALVLLLGVAAAGARSWWRNQERRDALGFLICWAVGWGIAVLTWTLPDLAGALFSHVPGAGLFRDGSRLLALTAPLLVTLVAHGAATLQARAGESGVARISAGAGLVLFPIAVLPDAAWGAGATLRAVDFPQSYVDARELVADEVADGRPGDVLVLPFTSYRAPLWNHHHKVLDPLGRFLTPDYVVNDELAVSGRLIEGEDERAADVRRALEAGTPEERAEALAGLGIGFVVTDRPEVHEDLPPGLAPEVAGESRALGDVDVVLVDEAVAARNGLATRAGMLVAWLAFAGMLAAGLFRGVTRIAGRISRKLATRW